MEVDPIALAGTGLSLEDVRTVLASTTVDEPKGGFTGSQQASTLDANDQLFHAADYKGLVLAYNNGSPIRLGDVARVTDSVENNRLAGWCDGKRSILLIVRRSAGANIISTIEAAEAAIPQLALSISPAIDIHVALDRTTTIRASVRDVERTLVITIGLVVMVVFLFLRRVWATIIPSVAVPLSIVGTFSVMYLLGYSIDNLSLMALTISTGFVVDDAIVMIENVTRFIELGETPFQAALKGSRQIGFTIISITVSLVAVLMPILLMGGIIGRLFREFAVTLSIAIAVSAVVSLTLTPMMSARFLQKETAEEQGPDSRARLERGFDRAPPWSTTRALRFVLRHQRLTLFVAIGTLILTVVLYGIVPKGPSSRSRTPASSSASPRPPPDVSFAAMSGPTRRPSPTSSRTTRPSSTSTRSSGRPTGRPETRASCSRSSSR